MPTGVGGVLITAVETTNRVLTEKALRASEERYRSAMMLGRIGSWEVDFVKGIRSWTPEGMALFGINLADGLGHVGGEADELRQSMHPEDRHLLAQYHALANTQDSFPAEYRIVKADGKVGWLSGYGRVLDRQTDGKAHHLINVATDITERKQVEAALGESEQRLRWLASIVESSDDAIVSKNLDGIITSWNRGAERIFGYTAEEAVGQPITIVIPQDRQDEERAILTRIRRGERIDHFETITATQAWQLNRRFADRFSCQKCRRQDHWRFKDREGYYRTEAGSGADRHLGPGSRAPQQELARNCTSYCQSFSVRHP